LGPKALLRTSDELPNVFQRTGELLLLTGSAMSIDMAVVRKRPEVIFETVWVFC